MHLNLSDELDILRPIENSPRYFKTKLIRMLHLVWIWAIFNIVLTKNESRQCQYPLAFRANDSDIVNRTTGDIDTKPVRERVTSWTVVVSREDLSLKRLFYAALAALTTVTVTATSTGDALAASSMPHKLQRHSMSQKIAVQASNVASSMCSVGFCYRGVKRALKNVGVALSGSSAFMAKRQLEQDRRFKKVSISALKAGDILVHGRSPAHPHGHIAVYLGNGREASDHIGRLITGRRYGGTTVFRVASRTRLATAVRNSRTSSRIIVDRPRGSAAPTVELTRALARMVPNPPPAPMSLTAALTLPANYLQ